VFIEQQHTRGQGLLELVDLVGLLHDERVQVLAAADLELGVPLVLLDLDPYRETKRQGEPSMIGDAAFGITLIAVGNVNGWAAYTGRPCAWR